MFYVLYDKNFKSIGRTRSTYPVNTWKWTRRAFEFDELTIEGMKFKNMDGAMFVALQEDRGTIRAVALSGIPSVSVTTAKINAIDPRRMLDTEALIDLERQFTGLTALYAYLISIVFDTYSMKQVSSSKYILSGGNPFSEIIIDCQSLYDNHVNVQTDAIVAEQAIGNVWNTIQSINAVHGTALLASIDIVAKALTFKVVVITDEININLEDFGTKKVVRDSLYTNRVICYNKEHSSREVYYLTQEDQVFSQNAVDFEKIQYPIQTKIFEADDISEARAEGLKELYNNRFKCNVQIDATSSAMGDLLKGLSFSTQANIYAFNSEERGVFKTLPLMEIAEDSNGNYKVTFGRLNNYWWLK